MSKTDITPADIITPADMGDIKTLDSRIDRIKYVLIEVIQRLPVEIGHATAEELLDELDSI